VVEKEKEERRRTMERRVQYLDRETKRADNTLRKTLDLHIRAE